MADRPDREGKEVSGFAGVQVGLGGEVEHGRRSREGVVSGAGAGGVSHGAVLLVKVVVCGGCSRGRNVCQ